MSTHNIGFYEDLTKIIFELSSNIIKYAPYFFCCVQVTIVYEVVMTSLGSYGEGSAFMTSSGMEYGDYIWISQDSFTLTETVAVIIEPENMT